MAVLWSPESGHIKELAKWELRPTEQVSAGMLQALGRPIVPPFQEYPKMLFKAIRATGGPKIHEYILAESAGHEQTLINRGYTLTQQAALDAVDRADQEIAQLAAQRAYSDRRMSAAAQAEAAIADESTPEHVASIDPQPVRKKPGRPAKVKE